MSNRILVVGNWKMNPATLEEARNIAQKTRRVASELSHTDVVICPPNVFVSVGFSRTKSANVHLGTQSVSPYVEGGPHTGEIGVHMLQDLGVEFVIAGHSEERARGISDAEVSKITSAIVTEGLQAIVCVGEDSRDEGGVYLEKLGEQIRNSLADVSKKHGKSLIIAYEPVWAIGAKEAMSPEQIYETVIFIKKILTDIFGQSLAMKTKVLYGGAVNAENAADIIKIGKVDGLLVGRESVRPESFAELLKTIDNIHI